jgi:hypothetical protein
MEGLYDKEHNTAGMHPYSSQVEKLKIYQRLLI